ncbi:hypothetical protein BH23VER1_BH23VER1_32660 [soil metagenome]
MAIKIIANYAKKLGLPGFSSHQFSVSVEAELTDLGQVQGESARLYGLLQGAVDREIQSVGFVPPDTYGMDEPGDGTKGNGHHDAPTRTGSGANGGEPAWACSGKQKDLILRLVAEYGLDRHEVDHLARQRFGAGVRQLNRLQASNLISEVLETCNTTPAKGGGRPGNGAALRKGGRP